MQAFPGSTARGNWKLYVAVLLGYLAVWTAVFAAGGVLNGGYDVIDDHEVLQFAHDVRAGGRTMPGEIGALISTDVMQTHRFRPLYYAFRVLQARVFGSRLLVWTLANLVWAGITCTLLFGFFRMAFGARWFGFALALLVFMGPQGTIWWWRGPAETPGCMLLALALACLGLWRVRRGCAWLVGFVVAAGLAALCKESFILILPGLALLPVALDAHQHGWKAALLAHKFVILALGAVMSVLLLCIMLLTGTNATGYAGVSAHSLGLRQLARTAYLFVRVARINPVCIAACAVAFAAWLLARGPAKLAWRPLLVAFAFGVVWIGPQVFLYARSGIGDRYLLPATFGSGILIMWLDAFCNGRLGRRALMICALAALAGAAVQTVRYARPFAELRAQNMAMLTFVTNHTNPQSRILLVADIAAKYEWALATLTYLQYVPQISAENIYIYPLAPPGDANVTAQRLATCQRWFPGRVLGELLPEHEFAAILVPTDPGQATQFLAKPPAWITRQFELHTLSARYSVLIRNP